MIKINSRLILSLGLLLSSAVVEAAIPVTTAPLKEFVIYPEHSAPAKVVSLNDATISAQIPALITSIPVQPGDRIEQGKTLVTLDCEDARLDHRSAVARRELAVKEARRARSLKGENNIAEQNYHRILTEETQARLAEQQNKLQIKRCRVEAPFTGIVTQRLAAKGELASPGTALLKMIDTKAVEVSAHLTPDALKQIQSMETLTFRFGDDALPVHLRTVLPLRSPSSGQQEARLQFTGKKALPGSSGRLVWKLKSPHLMASLLSQRNGEPGIFIAREGKAIFHPLPEAQLGHPAKIDLPLDTPVITHGRLGLRNGDAIESSAP